MRLPKNRPPIHPGEILLEEFLQPLELSQAAFARHIGWTTTKLSEIIKGKRGISHQSALDLADVFGTTPELWLNMQSSFDLWHALKQHQKKPLLKRA